MNFTARQIARRRISVLFQQASCTYKADPELARDYVRTARKIAMSVRIRFPPAYHGRVCKRCGAFLVPGETSRVRLQPRREPHVVVTCLSCGGQTRYPLKPKRKEKMKVE